MKTDRLTFGFVQVVGEMETTEIFNKAVFYMDNDSNDYINN